MSRVMVLLFGVFLALNSTAGSSRFSRNKSSQQAPATLSDGQRAIKVTIATAGPTLEPVADHYRVGQQVLITITMTNTTSQPVYACVSGDSYQDLPQLTKDGKLVPFTEWQSVELSKAKEEQTCQRENLPEQILLKPNEPTLIDWLVLADDSKLPTGAMPWYDPLTPGVYELTIQRRFDCCDGPMVQSDKISFAVEQ